jgi:hypothetical protein
MFWRHGQLFGQGGQLRVIDFSQRWVKHCSVCLYLNSCLLCIFILFTFWMALPDNLMKSCIVHKLLCHWTKKIIRNVYHVFWTKKCTLILDRKFKDRSLSHLRSVRCKHILRREHVLWDSKFSQLWIWRLLSSGMWFIVMW